MIFGILFVSYLVITVIYIVSSHKNIRPGS